MLRAGFLFLAGFIALILKLVINGSKVYKNFLRIWGVGLLPSCVTALLAKCKEASFGWEQSGQLTAGIQILATWGRS